MVGLTNAVPMQPRTRATFPISAASLPLPTGAATAANQTNVQSAPGTPQTTALTIQGNAAGVAVPVSGTLTTKPGTYTEVALDIATTTSANTAVNALSAGHRLAEVGYKTP